MRAEPSVLHLDLDAFYAAVEQRDKPSLRDRPVVVGGIGPRGVVATASYQARGFGVSSAMPTHEARRRCPHAAFLASRFAAYRESSERVMTTLRALSPAVEPLSLDEAYLDLARADPAVDLAPAALAALGVRVKVEVARVTGGLIASVGIATSKLMAKVASELGKPDGLQVVPPGGEVALLAPLPVRALPGVGPVTAAKLQQVGLRTVADLQGAASEELVRLVGRVTGESLYALARARDDREVEPERETKSISVEDTFETDLADRSELGRIATRQARQVAARLAAAGLFARTVTVKVRRYDFATVTRARTLTGGTDRAEVVAELAHSLLSGVDVTDGIRLLGVGVAGLTDVVQEDLFGADTMVEEAAEAGPAAVKGLAVSEAAWRRGAPGWSPGADVVHSSYGRGWVWGAGCGRVTVRFETRDTGAGPVRTFADDDPDLIRAGPLPLPPA